MTVFSYPRLTRVFNDDGSLYAEGFFQHDIESALSTDKYVSFMDFMDKKTVMIVSEERLYSVNAFENWRKLFNIE